MLQRRLQIFANFPLQGVKFLVPTYLPIFLENPLFPLLIHTLRRHEELEIIGMTNVFQIASPSATKLGKRINRK